MAAKPSKSMAATATAAPQQNVRSKEEEEEEGKNSGTGTSLGTRRMDKIKVKYPVNVWDKGKVMEAVRGYAGEDKQRFHRRWMRWSFVGMPATVPLGLIPV